jgi:hypothetical protein
MGSDVVLVTGASGCIGGLLPINAQVLTSPINSRFVRHSPFAPTTQVRIIPNCGTNTSGPAYHLRAHTNRLVMHIPGSSGIRNNC